MRKISSFVVSAAMILSAMTNITSVFAVDDASDQVAVSINADDITSNMDEITANGGYWDSIVRGSWSYGHIYSVDDPDSSANKVMALDNKWGGGASTFAQKNVGFDVLQPYMTEFKIRLPEIGVESGGLPYVQNVDVDLVASVSGSIYRMRNVNFIGDTSSYKLVAYTNKNYYQNGYEEIAQVQPQKWYKVQCINIPIQTDGSYTEEKSTWYLTDLETGEVTHQSFTHPFVRESGCDINAYKDAGVFFSMMVQGSDGSYKTRTTQVLIDDFKLVRPGNEEYSISLEKTSNVGVSEPISATCSRDINPDTVLSENISLKKEGTNDEIGVNATGRGNIVTITPLEFLEPGSTYVISFPGIEDVYGGNSSKTVSFITEARANQPFSWTLSPTEELPAANAEVTLNFVEKMDQSTFTSSAIKVVDRENNSVTFEIGDYTANMLVLRFPSLNKGETYTISLPGVMDKEGNTSVERLSFSTEMDEFTTLLPVLTDDNSAFNQRYIYKKSASGGLYGIIPDPDDTSVKTIAVGAYHWYNGTSGGNGQIGTTIDGTKPFVMDFDLKIKQPADTFYLENGAIQIGNITDATTLGAYTDILQLVPVLENGITIPTQYDLKVRIGGNATYRIARLDCDQYYSIQIAVKPTLSENGYTAMEVNYYINSEQVTNFYNEVDGSYSPRVDFPEFKVSAINAESLGIIFQGSTSARPAAAQDGANAAMYLKDFSIIRANKAGAYSVTPTEDVESYVPFTITFDRVINKNSVNTSAIRFYDSDENEIEVMNASAKDAYTVSFYLAKSLNANCTYKVIPAGIEDIYYATTNKSTEIHSLANMEDPDLSLTRTWWSTDPNPDCSNEITDVVKGEKNYCRINYINNASTEKNLYQITVLYHGLRMVDYDIKPVNFAANEAKSVITAVDVPNDEGTYRMKTFVWSDLVNMRPINGPALLPVE